MDISSKTDDGLIFRPDIFFLGPTRGEGVVRDRFGRQIDRCVIETIGRWDHNFGALHFDETFSYESGRVETLNWAIGPDPQGRMTASEASVTAPVRGWYEGRDYCLRFKRLGARPLDRIALTFSTRFCLADPAYATKTVRLSVLGVTLGTLTGYHRRIG